MATSKTTLLVLASTFPRWINDTEPRFVYDLCMRLKEDYKIIVLSPHCKGAKQQEQFDGLTVFRYRYAPEKFELLAYEGGITAKLKKYKLNWLVLPFFFLSQWLAIIKLLRQYPIAVIHAHWLIPQAILALVARLVSKNKAAIICTSHGGDLYSLNDPVSKIIKRYVLTHVDELTVVSTSMQKEIRKLVPQADMPTVAAMGTDLQQLFTPDDAVKRKPWQLLVVGRLVEKKGIRYLLEALPEVINSYPQVVLNIAGTGPEKILLESLIKQLKIENHVNFLGRIAHKQLVSEYRKAAIAIFPFVEAKNGDIEGLGLVTIEAQGCECPVIVSDIPAVRDVIVDGVTGVLTPPRNPQILANKLCDLLSSPAKSRQFAQQGREQVLKKFSWEVSAKQYSSLIKDLNVN